MATQSAPPPSNPADVNPQNPEVAQSIVDDRQVAKDISPPSVFVNSEPVREDQVQNAVKFLSHPKVKGSPVIYRRSFLERKGLTKQEIDEAFRRVPDTTPTDGQPAVANRDGQLSSSSNMQQQVPTQAPQPVAAIPSATLSKAGTVAHSWLGWQQILLAVGVLAISGAGTAVFVKNSIVPRLKSWIRKVASEEDVNVVKKTGLKPSVEEEAAAAAKAAAAAAADVARANQEILSYRSGEKRYFEELLTQLDKQVQEMKSMSNAIKNLEVKSGISGHEDSRVLLPGSVASYANGKSDFNFLSGRSVSPPMLVEPPSAPHPKSYMEIMDMAQRGEQPPNIREINDHTSNPNQPVPNPRVMPRPKPWEVGQLQNSLNLVPQSQDYGLANNQLNGDSSLPWLQQNNVRINEIEPGNEYKAGSSAFPTTDRPVQRSWVPPLPPPVAMAEAAAAIRQPKKSTYQSEALTDDQLFARSSELTDELQRITKISESGSATEANGGRLHLNTEIRTGQGNSYVEA